MNHFNNMKWFRHQDCLVRVRERHQGGVSWTEVVCGHMLSDSSASQICGSLEMLLIVNWQLAECMLFVYRRSIVEYWGRTHTSQSVPCLSAFDPQSPVCLTSLTARLNNPGTVGWHSWKRRALARYGCTCTSTGTERRHPCDCLWRIHLKFKQTTANKVQIKGSGKIRHCFLHWEYQRWKERR